MLFEPPQGTRNQRDISLKDQSESSKGRKR